MSKQVNKIARYCREDVLRAVDALTTRVTKWTPRDDEGLARLVSYLYHSKDYRKDGFIGDPLDELRSGLFTDTNFAGNRLDITSTSVVVLALYGPSSFYPLGSLSKRQSYQSLSTIEAETVSAFTGTRLIGHLAIDIREQTFGRSVVVDMCQDP